ncbi:GLPGLI family protein [Vaginella massiliensis]|uniref:GLPGLI family protein n=1 Tax=Vaginella massiliensis TaxID=1816680 RepID=UPI00139064DE|nr:GLPGLI family protein [Vaginella massiliensis]
MYTVLVILTLMNGCTEKYIASKNQFTSNINSVNKVNMENNELKNVNKKDSYTIEYVQTLKIDESKIAQLPPQAQQMVKDQLSKPRLSILETNGKESIYKTVVDDENNNHVEKNDGNKKIIKNTNFNFVGEVFYKNLETSTIYKTTEIKGEKFTVMQKSDLQNSWKITNETKSVGSYKAHKATLEDANLGLVTAWYVTEIAITDGPEIFNGLPGLIVEIETDKKHISLKSINGSEKEIQLPTFTNVLSVEEYTKKMDELKQQSTNTSSRFENSSGVKTNRIIIKSE